MKRRVIPTAVLLVAALLAFLLGALGTALQEPQPIPPFEGDNNPMHDGQPKWCQNSNDEFHGNCDCMPEMADPKCKTDGGAETSKCKTWCRKKCKCRRSCQDTE